MRKTAFALIAVAGLASAASAQTTAPTGFGAKLEAAGGNTVQAGQTVVITLSAFSKGTFNYKGRTVDGLPANQAIVQNTAIQNYGVRGISGAATITKTDAGTSSLGRGDSAGDGLFGFVGTAPDSFRFSVDTTLANPSGGSVESAGGNSAAFLPDTDPSYDSSHQGNGFLNPAGNIVNLGGYRFRTGAFNAGNPTANKFTNLNGANAGNPGGDGIFLPLYRFTFTPSAAGGNRTVSFAFSGKLNAASGLYDYTSVLNQAAFSGASGTISAALTLNVLTNQPPTASGADRTRNINDAPAGDPTSDLTIDLTTISADPDAGDTASFALDSTDGPAGFATIAGNILTFHIALLDRHAVATYRDYAFTYHRTDGSGANSNTANIALHIVPAPGALALVGLGGLAAMRRRRA